MKPQELLAQKPDAIVIDKFTGVQFEVRELTPVVVEIMKSNATEAIDFADRFVAVAAEKEVQS